MTRQVSRLKSWYSTRSRFGILLFGFGIGLGFSNVIDHDSVFIFGVCIMAVSGMVLGFWTKNGTSETAGNDERA
jgi:hypothetical protein